MQDGIDDAFGHWLAGFTDGEACFEIKRIQGPQTASYICRMTIGLRIDDRPILDEIARRTGLGTITISTAQSKHGTYYTPGRGDQARWEVSRKREVAKLAAIYERYPLRAKKRQDFEIWKRAVVIWMTINRVGSIKQDWTEMLQLRDALKTGRKLTLFRSRSLCVPWSSSS